MRARIDFQDQNIGPTFRHMVSEKAEAGRFRIVLFASLSDG